MRHQKSKRKLNRTSSHRAAMFNNLTTSLFEHERIRTTSAKAKDLRGVAERLITLGKKGDLHSIRIAARKIKNKSTLKKLFSEIAPRFKTRKGGYLRVLKNGFRLGDNAAMSMVELVEKGRDSSGG